MKVLHLIENIRFGGANRGVFTSAKHSKRLYGHEHTIIPMRSDDLAATDNGIAMAHANGMRTVVWPDKADYHKEVEQADVVLVQWWGSTCMLGLRYKNMMPCRLATLYHVAGTKDADANMNIITPIEPAWPDINVAVSMHTYDKVFADLPDERKAFVLAGGGGDFERFTHGRDPIPHGGFRVGLSCSLSFDKLYREWVHMSIAARTPATFRSCGIGRHEKAIKQEVSELAPGRFVFRGLLEDNDYGDEIRTWDVVGYPTVRDAAPVGLMDAMWFGVPPIVFAHTAPARMVVDGETGLLVHSDKEYIAALEYLYHRPDKRAEMSENAREYAGQHFGAENNASAFEELLQRLIVLPKRRHYSKTQMREEGIS